MMTAEELAQRAIDVGILSDSELQQIWNELGSRAVTVGEMSAAMVRSGFITNYQLDRLVKGLRDGYFYGDYKVLYNVGSGTFARVFRASHKVTGELFAVKVLRSRHSRDPAEAERFRREGELCQSLKHENIVPIHEVVSKGGVHYIVMDFIEGRNLREFYKVRKKFDPMEAAEIVSGMVAGLNYAFRQGVTHRDLKMSNVLVASDGSAKLVDFGLAGLDSEISEGESANARSIDYAGLERATGVRKDDTRSDIFFAGCIFYQLITGESPLGPETRDRMQRLSKARFQNIRPILDLEPKTPLPLALVIGKATEFDPQRRYQTPGDMLADLKIAIRRVKEGADNEGAKQSLESQEGLGDDGQPRKIMVVEADVKRQDLLRDLFKKNGYRVLVSSDPQRAIERFRSDAKAAELVVFCSGAFGRDAVDMFNQFGEDKLTSSLPAVLLLDEAHGQWSGDAKISPRRQVVVMPVKLKELRHAIRQVITA